MEELAPGGTEQPLGRHLGGLATHLQGRELGGSVTASGNFGSSRERLETRQEHARCQERSRLPPVLQGKAAISLAAGQHGTQQHKAPKDARIEGWFMRLSSIWYHRVLSPCHAGNAKCRALMRKLQAEHVGATLHPHRAAGTYL